MTRTESAATDELQIDYRQDVWHLTLQRADKGNALSAQLVTALTAAADAAGAANIRLLVISGAGKHFCTGFDLSNLDQENDDTLLARFVRVELLLQAIYAAPFSTLALAQGRTMGAGADIFSACADRWIVGDASFAFPGAAFGIVLGTSRLADIVGPMQARAWIEGGATIDSATAMNTGLATQRLDASTLDAEMARVIERIKRLDGSTQRAVHDAIDSNRRCRSDAGDAQDLKRLAQSAARPGLCERIRAYRAAQMKN